MKKYTLENYEEHVMDFLEGSMATDDRMAFQAFLDHNPVLIEEIQGLEHVRLPHLVLEFPKKEKLLKPIVGARSIGYWRRIAAAILLLCFLIILGISNKKPDRNLSYIPLIESPDEPSQKQILITDERDNNTADHENGKVEMASNETKTSITDSEKQRVSHLPKQEFVDKTSEYRTADLTGSFSQEPPNDGKKFKYSEQELDERNLPVTMSLIAQIEFTPTLSSRPILEMDSQLNVVEEEMEKEGKFKIGKLLARANLLPTGLKEEIASGGFREKIIPEPYSDSN